MFPKRVKRVHFVGIGGIGMSGIAEVLINLGYSVSGSDLRATDVTRRLVRLGGEVALGHAAEQVTGADVVVVSSAIREENPEVEAARRLAIPVIPRAEMLAELMRLKFGVAVSGTHGKTTTTSLVSTILAEASLDPTVVIGGKLNSLGASARLGQGDYMVAEADESDGSFLRLTPTIAIVTNIDPEHLEHYGSLEHLQDAFVSFANKVPFYGLVVLCLDHPNVCAVLPRIEKRYVTYGFGAQADYAAARIEYDGLKTAFDVVRGGEVLGRVTLQMPGEHNVHNSLAAIAVADELEIPFEVVSRALSGFTGVDRRFTILGERDGALLVDDYAHHPAEIATTLAGARRAFPGRRLIAVFQPHRYSRVRALLDEFATAFYDADCVVVTDVYAAGEAVDAQIDGPRVVDAIRRFGHKAVRYGGNIDEVVGHLEALMRPGDLVISLGAGDVWRVVRTLCDSPRGGAGAS